MPLHYPAIQEATRFIYECCRNNKEADTFTLQLGGNLNGEFCNIINHIKATVESADSSLSRRNLRYSLSFIASFCCGSYHRTMDNYIDNFRTLLYRLQVYSFVNVRKLSGIDQEGQSYEAIKFISHGFTYHDIELVLSAFIQVFLSRIPPEDVGMKVTVENQTIHLFNVSTPIN